VLLAVVAALVDESGDVVVTVFRLESWIAMMLTSRIAVHPASRSPDT
jgi:hypothetical protein